MATLVGEGIGFGNMVLLSIMALGTGVVAYGAVNALVSQMGDAVKGRVLNRGA